MKKFNIILSGIIAGAVLIAVLGLGLLIRDIKSRSELHQESSKNVKDKMSISLFSRDKRTARAQLSDKEIDKLRKQQDEIINQMANLSEEEKEKIRAQVRERFRARRFRNRPKFPKISKEEANRLKEKWQYPSPTKEKMTKADTETDANWRNNQENSANIPIKPAEPNEQTQHSEAEQKSVSE